MFAVWKGGPDGLALANRDIRASCSKPSLVGQLQLRRIPPLPLHRLERTSLTFPGLFGLLSHPEPQQLHALPSSLHLGPPTYRLEMEQHTDPASAQEHTPAVVAVSALRACDDIYIILKDQSDQTV